MDKPSHSPPSSDSSGDEGEVLTPAQRDSAATLPSSPPAAVPPPAPADPVSHPAPEDARIDLEFVKARFGEYLRRVEKKDNKGKAKKSSTKATPPLASQSGNGAPATPAATFPSTFNQYTQGSHYGTAPQQPQNTGMFPPPNPHPWAAGGTYGGTQGQPRFSNPFSGHQSFHMPQQPAVPHWFPNQWAALPDQGFGVPQPAMDRHWSFNQPQHG